MPSEFETEFSVNKQILIRACLVACIVGPMLTVINQWHALFADGTFHFIQFGLAGSVFKTLAGFGSKPSAYLLHFFAGIVCYPVAFALIGRPIWKKVAPALPWYVVAVIFGCIQWVFALYVMAHLVAGMPPFLKFTGITWAALYGHIIYAIVAIGISQHLTVSLRGKDNS